LYFKQNSISDYATIDPRIVLDRHAHIKDSNKDSLSDLETVDLKIFNTSPNDKGYYICIVANSMKSFRMTYSFLNVTHNSDDINYNNNDNIISNDLVSFYQKNKLLIIGFSIIIVLISILIIFSMCYCCMHCIDRKKKKIKNKSLYDQTNGYETTTTKKITTQVSDSKMNSMLGKTINSMKKVTIFLIFFLSIRTLNLNLF
jgi:hypothetical protein